MSTATLGFEIDSSQAKRAALDLDRLTASAAKAQKAAEGFGNAGRDMSGSLAAVEKLLSSIDKNTSQASLAIARIGKVTQEASSRAKILSQSFGQADLVMQRFIDRTTGVAPLKAWTGPLANMAAELDRLRAKFDPLFAAEQRHAAALAEIANAEKLGAISASTAVNARVKETAIYREQTAALDTLAAAKQKAEGIVGRATVAPNRAADITAYGNELDKLREKYNPVYAASKKYETELNDLNRALAVGAVSEKEHAAALVMLNGRYETFAKQSMVMTGAINTTTKAFRLNRMGMLELQAAGVNTFQALAAGIAPLQVAMMEGSQVVGAFVQGTEGLLSRIGASALSAVMSPGGAILGAFTAAGAAVLTYERYIKSGIPDADAVLKEHKALIDEITKAYPEAAAAAKRYEEQAGKLPASVLSAQSANNIANEKKLLKSYQDEIATQLAFTNNPQSALNLGYNPYEVKAFKELADALKSGRISLRDFVEQVGKLESDTSLGQAGHALAAQLEDVGKKAADAKAQIDGLGAAAAALNVMGGHPDNGEAAARLKQSINSQNTAWDLFTTAKNAVAVAGMSAYAKGLAQINQKYDDLIEKNHATGAALKQFNADRALETKAYNIDYGRQNSETLIAAADALKSAGLTGYARQLADINAAIATQIRLNPEATDTWRKVGEAQKQALDIETRRSLFEGQKNSLTLLSAEADAIGKSDDYYRRLMTVIQAKIDLERQGIDVTSKAGQAYVENAKKLSDFNAEVEKQKAAWDDVRQGGGQAIDDLVNGLTDGSSSIKDALKNVAKDLLKTFDQLAFANPLKNALLGEGLPTLSDLFAPKPKAPSLAIPGLGSLGTMANPMYVVPVGGPGSMGGGILGWAKSLFGFGENKSQANDNVPLSAAARAIQSIESGGNYGALGPITKSGDRAYGAYQVMGANIAPWTRNAIGYAMTPNQFLAAPWAQDAVFNRQFGGYASRFGMSGAAQAWFGGPGSVGRGGSVADMLGTTGTEYVNKFNAAIGKATDSTGIAAKGLGKLGDGFGSFGSILSDAGTGGASGGGLFGTIGKFLGSLIGIPMFADGTDFAPGGMAIVGERGPELLRLPRGSQVVPNNRLASAANQNSQPQHVVQMTLNQHFGGAFSIDDVRKMSAQGAQTAIETVKQSLPGWNHQVSVHGAIAS